MRIELDTSTKTVTILDECKLAEVVKMLKALRPKDWEKWTVRPEMITTVSTYPIWVSPPAVYPYPLSPQVPTITYMDNPINGIHAGISSAEVTFDKALDTVSVGINAIDNTVLRAN